MEKLKCRRNIFRVTSISFVLPYTYGCSKLPPILVGKVVSTHCPRRKTTTRPKGRINGNFEPSRMKKKSERTPDWSRVCTLSNRSLELERKAILCDRYRPWLWEHRISAVKTVSLLDRVQKGQSIWYMCNRNRKSLEDHRQEVETRMDARQPCPSVTNNLIRN